ncbi:helix-turn-helix domain-containing protein [Arthrobacter sp. ISL-65]|uniref:helix-turn-helix domain-containing protein n=1 Tax=Arthrobacter sp. ISL-65 TaxID=2819112 RepID=UPI0020357AC6|nr:helix-turn-helix domain-containing protein [Arthrobacter sp. ISL-65]
MPLTRLAAESGIPVRTIRHWMSRYRDGGTVASLERLHGLTGESARSRKSSSTRSKDLPCAVPHQQLHSFTAGSPTLLQPVVSLPRAIRQSGQW